MMMTMITFTIAIQPTTMAPVMKKLYNEKNKAKK